MKYPFDLLPVPPKTISALLGIFSLTYIIDYIIEIFFVDYCIHEIAEITYITYFNFCQHFAYPFFTPGQRLSGKYALEAASISVPG